uniref:Integrase_H2C2 domain-containing protein n=1 Tax=Anisakis simplex TaxID=6269 RepID=A0A0M3K858_ANISI
LKLIKSSLSATFSRETARFFVNSAQSRAVRAFLRTKRLICPDEYFWLTLAGNPKHVKLPASFDANKLLNDVERRREMDKLKMPSDNISVPYYISRYQRWIDRFNEIVSAKPCYGNTARKHALHCTTCSLFKMTPINQIIFDYSPISALLVKVNSRSLKPYGDIPGAKIMRHQSISEWANTAI